MIDSWGGAYGNIWMADEDGAASQIARATYTKDLLYRTTRARPPISYLGLLQPSIIVPIVHSLINIFLILAILRDHNYSKKIGSRPLLL